MQNTWIMGLTVGLRIVIVADVVDAQGISFKVELRNDGGVGDSALDAARTIVAQIYGHAGTNVVWSNDSPHFTIILKRRASDEITRRSGDAIGFAPGTDSERGRLAFVMMNRVNRVADGYSASPSIVLGAAIAHELGHLLLFKGHTPSGLMRPYWNQSDFRNVRNGQLHFTADQAQLIRSRLSRLP